MLLTLVCVPAHAPGVLALVEKAAVAGVTTIELCKTGDALILAETVKVYNKKDEAGVLIKKGAFAVAMLAPSAVILIYY